MADPDLENGAASSTMRVPALMREYQRQQDSWRDQTFELARLRSQLLAAGEQDAESILTSARAAIRRVLVDARRELLGLAVQVDAIKGVNQSLERSGPTSRPVGDELDSRNRILAVRRDLRRVVAEARHDLNTLQNDARAVQITADSRRLTDPQEELDAVERDRSIAPVATVQLPSKWARRAMVWTGIVTVAGGAIALGSVNSYRRATTGARETITATPHPTPLRPNTAAKSDESSSPPVVMPKVRAAAWVLLVQARRPAWIQATIDGRVETGRLFGAGEIQRMTAAREVSLRVGDAGAVFVSAAGRQPAALGRDGEVVTRRFTPDGPAAPTDPRGSASIPPAAGSVAQTPSEDRSRRGPGGSAVGDRSPAPTVGMASTALAVSPERQTATLPAPGSSETSRDLTDAAQRWLEAYYRHDVVAMRASASPDISVSDDRRSSERPPAGLSQLRLALEQVTCQIVGDTAVLTGRMTEQIAGGNDLVAYVSWISQTWLRGTGQWRLVDVRIVSDSKLQKK